MLVFWALVMTTRSISEGGFRLCRDLHIKSCRLTCKSPCLDKYRVRSRVPNDFVQKMDSRNSPSSSRNKEKMPDFCDIAMSTRRICQGGFRLCRDLHIKNCRLTSKSPCFDKYKIRSRVPNDFGQKMDSRNSPSSSRNKGKVFDFWDLAMTTRCSCEGGFRVCRDLHMNSCRLTC